MVKTKLIRGMTLLVFVFFITAFMLYRTGKFDSYLSSESSVQTSPNGGNVNAGGIDTLPKAARDSLQRQRVMLSSSKSMVLTDIKLSFTDSLKINRRIDSTNRIKRTMLSSSKSGHVIFPEDPVFMPSSKSGPVFVPRKKTATPIPKYDRDSLRLRLVADSATHIKR